MNRPDPDLPLWAVDQACKELAVGQFELCWLVLRGKVLVFLEPDGVFYQPTKEVPVTEPRPDVSKDTGNEPKGFVDYDDADLLPREKPKHKPENRSLPRYARLGRRHEARGR